MADGSLVYVTTQRGRCTAPGEISDTMRPGRSSLPNGYGIAHGLSSRVTGVPPTQLTNSARRDWLAGTPWHEHVPARVERADTPAAA